MKKRTVIRIFGAPRSGTTMLQQMLAGGPGTLAVGEIGNQLVRPPERRQADHWPPAMKPFINIEAQTAHVQLLDHFGAHTIIDNSKNVFYVVDSHRWALKSGLRVVNFLIYKQPVDWAYSMWKRGGSWNGMYLRHHLFHLHSGLEFVAVPYQELVRNPRPMLERICVHASLPYSPDMLDFWDRSLATVISGSAGVRKQHQRGHSKIVGQATYPTDFEETRQHVEHMTRTSPLLHHIRRGLLRRDVMRVAPSLHGHRYAPNPLQALAFATLRFVQQSLGIEMSSFRARIQRTPSSSLRASSRSELGESSHHSDKRS